MDKDFATASIPISNFLNKAQEAVKNSKSIFLCPNCVHKAMCKNAEEPARECEDFMKVSKISKVKRMDEKTIKAAESVLAKGYSVELRPVKDGIRVIKVIREQVAKQSNKEPSP